MLSVADSKWDHYLMVNKWHYAIAGVILTAAALMGLAAKDENGTAFTMFAPNDYARIGIENKHIKAWEDGIRTESSKSNYEWWYFDSRLGDGSTLVIVFFTKDMINPGSGLEPQIMFNYDRPDGKKIEKLLEFPVAQFSASKEKCEVKIGDNIFSGDLHNYSIHVAFDDIVADIKLDGEVPSWRPETGHINFSSNGKNHFFAWLPSIPNGKISGNLTIANKTECLNGSGYHDHNWGDVSMFKLIHHWYWGRAQVGEYSVISSYITATDSYGNSEIPIFMLAKNGVIVADNCSKVIFSTSGVHINGKTGKPVADKIVYDYDDKDNHYRVTYNKKAELVEMPFVDMVSGIKWLVAKLIRFDGAYLRFTGSVLVEKIEGNQIVESVIEDSAVWELMYFGHVPHAAPSARPPAIN